MKNYSKYSKYLVAVDCIVFGYDIQKKILKLLLVKRNFEPAKGSWSLPGGFVKKRRVLMIQPAGYFVNLPGSGQFPSLNPILMAIPTGIMVHRVISTAYYALIAIRDIDQEIVKDNGAHWRPVSDLPRLIFDHLRNGEESPG